MRRRPVESDAAKGIPAKLRRFVPSDWPGATVMRQCWAWSAAVDAYAEAHPDVDVQAHIENPGDIPWNPEVDPP